MTWYNKYVGIPYEHLGIDAIKGIDCFNLSCHVLREELRANISLYSHDFCNIVDENWSSKMSIPVFELGSQLDKPDFKWLKLEKPELFSVIVMSIGSTNISNHAALYVDNNRILQTMQGRKSWVSPYGKFYKQYTTGIYKWIGLVN